MENRRASALGAAVLTLVAAACGPESTERVGTPELRAALADTILARTERREAWSPAKNAHFGFDPMDAMRAIRDEVVAAETEEDLFYAIAKMSHARRDRHLDIGLVPGGLEVSDSTGLQIGTDDGPDPMRAPVRVFPDFSQDGAAFFVGDVAASDDPLPSIGSMVASVNGLPVDEWYAEATKYMRHSTTNDLRWELANAMTLQSAVFPPELRGDGNIALTVLGPDGEERSYDLDVHDPAPLEWQGVSEPAYDGFEVLLETVTFDMHVDDAREIIVLVWTGFRQTMIDDVHALLDLAVERDMLDYTLIVDVTRSGGGSRGAYAVQRLQPKAFKTTFGNLRISDVTVPFVENRRAAFEARRLEDSGVPETIDDGTWLMDWFQHDVMPAVERGDAYTNNVPFKSAHAPRDSDGVLQPAAVHFRGPFAVISGPSGGSHLDQFIHQVVDNDLGPVVGMPPGGYSNTWEWDEVLTLPGTDQPVVSFMWNVGHTITPNGEIAEGDPAEIDEWIPLTPENVRDYYGLLLEAALRHLETR